MFSVKNRIAWTRYRA